MLFAKPLKFPGLVAPHAVRILNPQYATTTKRTTHAVSKAVSTGESRIAMLSFAHPAVRLCDSIMDAQLKRPEPSM
jgi:hypothetical protein